MAGSVFDKYGGFAAVSKIVSAFYDKAIDSDVIGPYFDDIDMRRLVDHQTKFIAYAMGGPASFSNDALRLAHQQRGIDRTSFEEMARLLRQTLEEYNLQSTDVDAVMREIEGRAELIISEPAS